HSCVSRLHLCPYTPLFRSGSRDLNRVRARASLDEALRILRSLPATPEREERIGLILMNRVRSGLEDQTDPLLPFRRGGQRTQNPDRKSTRLNSSHVKISYA